MIDPTIVLITGERQVGKTTACLRAVTLMRQADLEVSGLVTTRTGCHALSVRELHTGAVYPLTLPFEDSTDRPLMNFRMDPEAMARSETSLARAFPTDVVVIDELGPLEFRRGEGWTEAFDYLRQGKYHLGILVVRPELLVAGVRRLPMDVYTVVRVTPANRDRVPMTVAEMAKAAVARARTGEELEL
jgi:nucleoside-triphosphatase